MKDRCCPKAMFWRTLPSIILSIAAAIPLATSSNAASPERGSARETLAQGARWWRDIEVLAGDDFEGRQTGSRGYLEAAKYVAGQFKSSGLEPMGTQGYFQEVRFIVQQVIAERSSVVLYNADGSHTVRIGADFAPGSRMAQPPSVDAPLVFIGYGLHLPDAGIDEFKDADLRGKIGVYLNGGPNDLSANLRAHARNAELWAAAERSGALGLIMIPMPKAMDIPWSRQALLALQPGMYPADPESQFTTRPMFAGIFNPAAAELLFAHSGHPFAQVIAQAEAHQRLKSFALNASIRASIMTSVHDVVSPNVIARLRGSDPELREQYVVVSAHLDHLGVGEPIDGDRIYHGAMDDASGVASVLEVARKFEASGVRPKRSILFLIVTAEEKGLFGSRYYALHPTVPRQALVADLNMDMPLPLWPLRYISVSGMNESTLGDQAKSAAARFGYEAVADPHPDRNFFVRTDQYSFVRIGVPAVALAFAPAPGTNEGQIEQSWLTTRYHSPADNLTQPVDLSAAAAFNTYVAALARQVADSPQAPAWLETSYFRHLAH
jgi:hypothetical protein